MGLHPNFMSASQTVSAPAEDVQYDPTRRYQKSGTQVEQSHGIRHVYKAFDTETAVEVAWQEYWGLSGPTMNAIEKNIETLKSLNHAHIIKYHEGWVDRKQKKVVLITEAMPTGRGSITNVRRFLSRNVKMRSSVLKNWLEQVLRGLEFLHAQEIPCIHRDLRCENIYIRSNVGRLKVGGLELGIFMQASHPAEFDGFFIFICVLSFHSHCYAYQVLRVICLLIWLTIHLTRNLMFIRSGCALWKCLHSSTLMESVPLLTRFSKNN